MFSNKINFPFLKTVKAIALLLVLLPFSKDIICQEVYKYISMSICG